MCIFRRNKKATESVASTLNRRRITITNRLNSYINLWEPRYLFDMEFKTEENNARINRTNEDTIEKLKASYQIVCYAYSCMSAYIYCFIPIRIASFLKNGTDICAVYYQALSVGCACRGD